MSTEKPTSSEPLISAVRELADEVRTLREVIEELRVCFEWAVHNDRLRDGSEHDSWLPVTAQAASAGKSPTSARLPAIEPPETHAVLYDLHEKQALVLQAMDDVKGLIKTLVPVRQKTLFPTDNG